MGAVDAGGIDFGLGVAAVSKLESGHEIEVVGESESGFMLCVDSCSGAESESGLVIDVGGESVESGL